MSSTSATNGRHTEAGSLDEQCGVLRDLHVPGRPLVLPNAWDAATASAVVSAGFPVVATTSGGVAASLGYEDHEGAPAAEMLGAAARIAKSVDVPLTVDAEAGYGLNPEELVDALRETGAAGCNLEDSNHREGRIRDADEHAEWLRAVRQAASRNGYPLVINARIDVFLAELLAGSKRPQRELVPEALHRARAYVDAGVDCVFPIALWEPEALEEFIAAAPGPVNILAIDRVPALPELARLGVARVSWGSLLHGEALERFGERLRGIPVDALDAPDAAV
jgi:2-methylisocitrate lyase-like PEP mutase family enzyme